MTIETTPGAASTAPNPITTTAGAPQPAAAQSPAPPPATAPAQPAPPPATPPSAQAAPAAVDPSAKPPWLDERLERERRATQEKILKDLGVEDVDAAKKAIADAKAKADAEKSAAEKAAEYKTKLDAESRRAAEYEATLKEHAARMLVGLTDEQKAAVSKLAGDDPLKQLQTIQALAPTWAKREAEGAAAAAAAAAAKAAANAATVPPHTTAPPATAPSGTQQTSPPNHREVYEALRKTNPFAASQYATEHPEAYRPKV
jgi:hypothetical protein